MTSIELIRRYVSERSETAFAELVRQHINLVYSAALRQVGGDTSAAEDVTQAVFTDLARKAPGLTRHTSLTGWLYTSTRYRAAHARRAEQCRRHHEREAHEMNQLLQSNEADSHWQELRPLLDDAMHDLSANDREVVLLRYFDGLPLAEIGARLGLKGNTARMRVDRALDRLREALAKRGVTSTVAALAAALSARAVGIAPAGMAGKVSQSVVTTVGAGGGTIAGVWKWLVGAGATVTVVGVLVLPKFLHQSTQAAATPSRPTAATPTVIGVLPEASPGTLSTAPASSANSNLAAADTLTLRVVAADSGQPIPSVKFVFWSVFGSDAPKAMKPLVASPAGVCEVTMPPAGLTELVMVSQREGFADTRLQWHVDRGETIPKEYTLCLARAVTIGGTVVDADGNPVPDALLDFGNQVDPAADLAIESSDFGVPYHIEVTTDSRGHWQTSRVARETLRTLSGGATHPLHVPVGFQGGDAEIQKQLLAGTYEFKMGRAVQARGTIVDNIGNPLANAKVSVWSPGNPPRETNSGANGHFLIAGCAPDKALLSAEAKGFAPTTISVDLSENTGPFQLTLPAGKLLRLRVVDAKGLPVTNAYVWLDTIPRGPLGPIGPTPVQTEFHSKADSDGRVEWSSAPDGELTFDFSAPGYWRLNGQKFSANGQEHTVTLSPALTIAGTVRDAMNGALIPSFRMAVGFPETNPLTGVVVGHWTPINRFWLSFTGGKFRHDLEEAVIGGTPNPVYIFKFEADGYTSVVSRPVVLAEGEVQLDIAMQPASTTTVTVTLPDGRPADNVDIGLVSPNAALSLIPGGFSRVSPQSGGRLLSTDSQGQFRLNPDTITRVIAAGADGYAETTPAALAEAPVMVLQPWGRLEGTLLVQGHAGTNRTLSLEFRTDNSTGVSTYLAAYQVKTDADGHFVFPQVPSGSHRLMQATWIQMMTRDATFTAWANEPLTNVDIRPGETTTVSLDSGRP